MRTAVACLLAACSALSCSANPAPSAPPATAPAAAPAAEAVDPGASGVDAEIGGLNQERMERAFAEMAAPLERCVSEGVGRVREFGGRATLSLRIDREGHARWVYFAETTLGDREAERCLLDAARAKTWPRPVGGDGLAQKSFDIEPRVSVNSWSPSPKSLTLTLKPARNDLYRCRKGAPGSYEVTGYLRRGRLVVAGVTPPDEKGEEAVDCLVDALRGLQFWGAPQRTTKIAFTLP